MSKAVSYALWAAVFFGMSAPFSKMLLNYLDPIFLAGVFYLGSGIGLTLYKGIRRMVGRAPRLGNPLHGIQWRWMAGSVVTGGIVAPILLLIGLQRVTAAAGALLLNFEGVFTALLAWLMFREVFRLQVLFGLLAIVTGGVILAWIPEQLMSWSWKSLAIAGASLAWAIDNNCTRRISEADAIQIVEVKGWVAGVVNILLGYWCTGRGGGFVAMTLAGLLGFISGGLCMILLVKAFRELGAARTGAYFSTSPFIGAGMSILVLHDPTSKRFCIAAVCMAFGVWLNSLDDGKIRSDSPAG